MYVHLISLQVKSCNKSINSIIFIFFDLNNSSYSGLLQYQVDKTAQIPHFIIKVGLHQDLHSMEIVGFWVKEGKIGLNDSLQNSEQTEINIVVIECVDKDFNLLGSLYSYLKVVF